MKHYAIALLATIFLASCAKKQSTKNLVITGKINGLKKGTLFIERLNDSMLVVLDSIPLNGTSEFRSEIELESPEMLYLFLDRGPTSNIDNSLMVFAEPGAINIETSLKHFYAEAKITGSKNHELYEQFRAVNGKFNNQQLDLTEARLKALQSGDAYAEEEHKKKSDAITKRRYLHAINFAMTNKDAEVAPFIALSEISDVNIKYLDTINNALTPEVSKSKYGNILRQYIEDRKKVEN